LITHFKITGFIFLAGTYATIGQQKMKTTCRIFYRLGSTFITNDQTFRIGNQRSTTRWTTALLPILFERH